MAHSPGTVARRALLDLFPRRAVVLVGHFGSGKSEIAVNLAFGFQACGTRTTLVDLDVVTPYFRCRLAKDDLEARGIRLVAPEGDRFYADLPILVPEVRGLARGGGRVIFDVGGHDVGARVLGSLSGLLDREATDLLFVVNANRPFAEDLDGCEAMLQAIQTAARIRATGLVANTHLMDETTPAIIDRGLRLARALASSTGIPVRCVAMQSALAGSCRAGNGEVDGLTVLPLERYIVAPFAMRPQGSRPRRTLL